MSNKIYVGMTDTERYEILKTKLVSVVPCHPEKLHDNPAILKQLEKATKYQARKILKPIISDFKIKDKHYFNPEIDLSFNVSSATISESINKQMGRFDNFAKMLTCFEPIMQSAIGIEAHKNRYGASDDIKETLVLMGAFKDKNNVIPVKMEVRELKDVPNKLYLSVALCPIKIKEAAIPARLGFKPSHAPATSAEITPNIISIHRLVEKINPLDKHFLKYFPDQMLDEAQKQAKTKALIEDVRRMAYKVEQRNKKNAPKGGHYGSDGSGL